MDEPGKHVLREMRQTFNVASAAMPDRLVPGLGKTHRAKVFKSGNSLALRLPKALGLEAGMEMELTTAPDGSHLLRTVEPVKPRLDISGFWGKAKHLKVPERRDFDERPSTIAARLAEGRV
jgi:antitoxin VapB